MLSVAVTTPGEVQVIDIPRPEPGPYEAVVRTEVAFICNATDRKVADGHFPGLGPEKFPLLLGHESAGIVESIGEKVTSFRPGDRVIGALLLRPTRAGLNSAWGGDSECIVATDHAAMVTDGVADDRHGWVEVFQIMRTVPGDIDVLDAALLCTWREVYAGFSDFRLKPGDDILIFGGGPVGLSFCRFARILGLGWIGLVDPRPFKREKAMSLGADETFAPDSPEVAKLATRRKKPLDAVIDAVGREDIINRGLPLIRLAGSICVYGVLSATSLSVQNAAGPLNFNLFMHQWPTRSAESAAQEPLVDWIRSGRLSSRDFVSGEFPVRDAAAAIAASRGPTSIKTLLRF